MAKFKIDEYMEIIDVYNEKTISTIRDRRLERRNFVSKFLPNTIEHVNGLIKDRLREGEFEFIIQKSWLEHGLHQDKYLHESLGCSLNTLYRAEIKSEGHITAAFVMEGIVELLKESGVEASLVNEMSKDSARVTFKKYKVTKI